MELYHLPVEHSQCVVFKIFIFCKLPLASGIFEAPVISFAGKVNPFRMTKFIPHKVQVTPSGSAEGDKPDHLMQSNTAVHNDTMIRFIHP